MKRIVTASLSTLAAFAAVPASAGPGFGHGPLIRGIPPIYRVAHQPGRIFGVIVRPQMPVHGWVVDRPPVRGWMIPRPPIRGWVINRPPLRGWPVERPLGGLNGPLTHGIPVDRAF